MQWSVKEKKVINNFNSEAENVQDTHTRVLMKGYEITPHASQIWTQFYQPLCQATCKTSQADIWQETVLLKHVHLKKHTVFDSIDE